MHLTDYRVSRASYHPRSVNCASPSRVGVILALEDISSCRSADPNPDARPANRSKPTAHHACIMFDCDGPSVLAIVHTVLRHRRKEKRCSDVNSVKQNQDESVIADDDVGLRPMGHPGVTTVRMWRWQIDRTRFARPCTAPTIVYLLHSRPVSDATVALRLGASSIGSQRRVAQPRIQKLMTARRSYLELFIRCVA